MSKRQKSTDILFKVKHIHSLKPEILKWLSEECGAVEHAWTSGRPCNLNLESPDKHDQSVIHIDITNNGNYNVNAQYTIKLYVENADGKTVNRRININKDFLRKDKTNIIDKVMHLQRIQITTDFYHTMKAEERLANQNAIKERKEYRQKINNILEKSSIPAELSWDIKYFNIHVGCDRDKITKIMNILYGKDELALLSIN
tara:strand:- start:507 stop:1109 length:603 start_codon:yes stop_codon:yes gene_type:complete